MILKLKSNILSCLVNHNSLVQKLIYRKIRLLQQDDSEVKSLLKYITVSVDELHSTISSKILTREQQIPEVCMSLVPRSQELFSEKNMLSTVNIDGEGQIMEN